MKNHPLFNGNETSRTREAIDVRFINIVQFDGGKRVTLTDQWLPEQLMTPEQLFHAVGAGQFELLARDERGKVVDREIITIRPPRTAENQAPQPQAAPPMPPVPPMPMQGGGLQIPQNADPVTAMMFMMMNVQMQGNMALREESRFAAQNQTQLMSAFLESQSNMVTGLANAFAGRGGNSGGGIDQAGTAFIKGVEAMGSLFNGFKEGQAQNQNQGDAPNWTEVSKNIFESLKQIADIAKATSSPAAGPVVPPGDPNVAG